MKAKVDFRDVIHAYKSGAGVQDIADRFGISKAYVSTLVSRYGANFGVAARQPRNAGDPNDMRPSQVARRVAVAERQAAATAKREALATKPKRAKREQAGRSHRRSSERGGAATALINTGEPRPITLPSVRGWTSAP